MFSLIITIISIALVAALALATLYYGGDAFNQGRAGAEASRIINEGQQVAGGVSLAAATNVTVATLADLTPNVLAQLPVGVDGTTDVADGFYVIAGVEDAVCDEVEERAGQTAPLADALPATVNAVGQTFIYGCAGTAGAARDFFFKF